MKSRRVTAQELPFIRSRDDPYLCGLLGGPETLKDQASISVFQRSANSGMISPSASDISDLKISQSTSDISEIGDKKIDLDVSEKSMESTLEDSVCDIRLDPSVKYSPMTGTTIARTSFSFPTSQSASSFHADNVNNLMESSPLIFEATEPYNTSPDLTRHSFVKSYSMNRTRPNLSKIPLPQSAASFYNGFSPQIEIVESCESISRLNSYLKARKDDVSAGVPGKFLHAVLGQDVPGVGSLASTIIYAFYLHSTLENDMFCTVPVINMRRADLNSHAELKWLLDSCQIDQSSLIFIDEIDLSYYDLFGSLKLVLVNGHKLPMKQEALKEAVVEIFNCRKGESVYPCVETVSVGQDCSCCTVVAEKFALISPEILAGQGFSRFLLAGILLDTGNLTNAHCTPKDKYMATLLINGAGRFGCNGLHQILRYLMYDVSALKVVDILRKDFKKWRRGGKAETVASRPVASHIGMSSVGISVEQLLTHEDAAPQEIRYFQQLEKVRLLMIVSGYYDLQKNFKREILVSAESVELMRNLLSFFASKASQLPLQVLHQPGLREEMTAFEVDKVTSRKTIERLLEEFGRT